MLGLVLYFGVLLGVLEAYDRFNSFGEKIDFGNKEEIYYANGVTEAGHGRSAHLREAKYFNGR